MLLLLKKISTLFYSINSLLNRLKFTLRDANSNLPFHNIQNKFKATPHHRANVKYYEFLTLFKIEKKNLMSLKARNPLTWHLISKLSHLLNKIKSIKPA